MVDGCFLLTRRIEGNRRQQWRETAKTRCQQTVISTLLRWRQRSDRGGNQRSPDPPPTAPPRSYAVSNVSQKGPGATTRDGAGAMFDWRRGYCFERTSSRVSSRISCRASSIIAEAAVVETIAAHGADARSQGGIHLHGISRIRFRAATISVTISLSMTAPARSTSWLRGRAFSLFPRIMSRRPIKASPGRRQWPSTR